MVMIWQNYVLIFLAVIAIAQKVNLVRARRRIKELEEQLDNPQGE